jgi:HD-GYP domain-containing protein (c-di-GMP phosphodiesterase class II)
VKQLRYGGILHDIGKIGITESILCKQTQLTPDEMSSCASTRHRRLHRGPVSFLGTARDAVRSHHEKWNGTGLPRGPEGPGDPLIARVVACADTWDACTSTRPYQRAMGAHAAMEVMNRLRGRVLDPTWWTRSPGSWRRRAPSPRRLRPGGAACIVSAGGPWSP